MDAIKDFLPGEFNEALYRSGRGRVAQRGTLLGHDEVYINLALGTLDTSHLILIIQHEH